MSIRQPNIEYCRAVVRLLLSGVLTAFGLAAHATEPCIGLSEAEFRKVIDMSDIAVDGNVEDFSKTDANAADINATHWTRIKVTRTLKGKAVQELIVQNWQAFMLPLYGYQAGDRMILLLKHDGNDYILTNDTWAECVPSVTYVAPGGKIYSFTKFKAFSEMPIDVDAFEKEVFAPKQ